MFVDVGVKAAVDVGVFVGCGVFVGVDAGVFVGVGVLVSVGSEPPTDVIVTKPRS